jgi:uncharacterized protein (DUF433 family)
MSPQISMDPVVFHGKPVIKGTRVLVTNILADLTSGESHSDIQRNYPGLSEENIRALVGFEDNWATA